MAALGVAGIIFYPVGIFWIIWKFPAPTAAGRSIVLGGDAGADRMTVDQYSNAIGNVALIMFVTLMSTTRERTA